jgi:hypothetical protein
MQNKRSDNSIEGQRMSKWEIKRVTRKFKVITEIELHERLAGLWEILVQGNGQFERSQVPVKVESKGRLLNPLLKRGSR